MGITIMNDSKQINREILFITEAAAGKDKNFYRCNTVLFRSIKTAFEMQFGKNAYI